MFQCSCRWGQNTRVCCRDRHFSHLCSNRQFLNEHPLSEFQKWQTSRAPVLCGGIAALRVVWLELALVGGGAGCWGARKGGELSGSSPYSLAAVPERHGQLVVTWPACLHDQQCTSGREEFALTANGIRSAERSSLSW